MSKRGKLLKQIKLKTLLAEEFFSLADAYYRQGLLGKEEQEAEMEKVNDFNEDDSTWIMNKFSNWMKERGADPEYERYKLMNKEEPIHKNVPGDDLPF